jgi:hypothetical protein
MLHQQTLAGNGDESGCVLYGHGNVFCFWRRLLVLYRCGGCYWQLAGLHSAQLQCGIDMTRQAAAAGHVMYSCRCVWLGLLSGTRAAARLDELSVAFGHSCGAEGSVLWRYSCAHAAARDAADVYWGPLGGVLFPAWWCLVAWLATAGMPWQRACVCCLIAALDRFSGGPCGVGCCLQESGAV